MRKNTDTNIHNITNLNALRAFDDDFLSGASLLENEYNNLEEV